MYTGGKEMIRDLLINMSLLISFISIVSHILKEKEINTNTSLKVKVAGGLITGLLGVTLIYFGFRPTDNTIIDFRNIVLTMSAIYGGPVALLICALSIALFRIAFFGVSSISAIIITAIICAVDVLISKQKLKMSTRWTIAAAINTIAININIWQLLKGNPRLWEMIVIYSFSSMFVSLVTYRYLNYSLTANILFRKLKSESANDYLTGLNNVRSFDQQFNQIMKTATEKNEQVSLLMIDIDFFKKVNDTYGHHQGDIVLKELGNILTKNSRSFDIVSRNGGEEFTVILLDCHINQALSIAERIRTAVEKAEILLPDRRIIKITISIGVANYPESSQQKEYLLELADSALYQAKRTGRNKVVIASNLTYCASS